MPSALRISFKAGNHVLPLRLIKVPTLRGFYGYVFYHLVPEYPPVKVSKRMEPHRCGVIDSWDVSPSNTWLRSGSHEIWSETRLTSCLDKFGMHGAPAR